jgi:hypothetical protein
MNEARRILAATPGMGLGSIPVVGTLAPGWSLRPQQGVWSPTKNHVLVMQSDNNLVIYDEAWHAIWASNTRSGAVRAIMQTDGNFVLYRSPTSTLPRDAVWNTGTYGNPGAWLFMQNDGNLVVYDANDRALWASGT